MLIVQMRSQVIRLACRYRLHLVLLTRLHESARVLQALLSPESTHLEKKAADGNLGAACENDKKLHVSLPVAGSVYFILDRRKDLWRSRSLLVLRRRVRLIDLGQTGLRTPLGGFAAGY